MFGRLKEKAKEKLGQATEDEVAVDDAAYAAAVKQFSHLEEIGLNVQAEHLKWQKMMAGATKSTLELSRMMKKVYCSEEHGNPQHGLAAPSEAFFTEAFHLADQDLSMREVNLSISVGVPLEEITSKLANFKEDIKDRGEALKELGHYRHKLEEMNAAEKATTAKGKPVKQKDVEHRERNEKKCEDAEEDYEAKNKIFIEEVNDYYEKRFDMFDPIFTKLLDAQVQNLEHSRDVLLTFQAKDGDHRTKVKDGDESAVPLAAFLGKNADEEDSRDSFAAPPPRLSRRMSGREMHSLSTTCLDLSLAAHKEEEEVPAADDPVAPKKISPK